MLQLFVIITKEGQDVEKRGPEFPQGLQLLEAVAFMESRQFTRGIRLLDFLVGALDPPSNMQRQKANVLRNIRKDRLHVSLRAAPLMATPLLKHKACQLTVFYNDLLMAAVKTLQAACRLMLSASAAASLCLAGSARATGSSRLLQSHGRPSKINHVQKCVDRGSDTRPQQFGAQQRVVLRETGLKTLRLL